MDGKACFLRTGPQELAQAGAGQLGRAIPSPALRCPGPADAPATPWFLPLKTGCWAERCYLEKLSLQRQCQLLRGR